MKEAAGEANITIITIILIGLVSAAGFIIIPRLINSMKDRSCCQEQGGYVDGSQCVVEGGSGGNISGYRTNCPD